MNKSRQLQSLARRQETREFLAAIFEPDDLVELRLIETWRESGVGQSRVVNRCWTTPAELMSQWPTLQRRNEAGVNILFAVNPRRAPGGSKKNDVGLCRVLWADLDDARPGDESRWQALPPPSVIIDSGRGVHLYWRLYKPVLMQTTTSRLLVESVLKGMYGEIGSDAVQDVSRLLRLPGFLNVKEFKNGGEPAPCRLVQCCPSRTYDFLDFQRFAVELQQEGRRFSAHSAAPGIDAAELPKSHDMKRIRGLLRVLAEDSEDRSKRDFFVVTKLLSLGCTPDEVAALVKQYSKFAGNDAYLERTIENAFRIATRGE